MSFLTAEHPRFANFTPEGYIDSSVPTPDSASNGQISRSRNPSAAGSRSGFYPLQPNSNHSGSNDLMTHQDSPRTEPSIFMETSFRVMSPENEVAAASLRTLQGIRVPNEVLPSQNSESCSSCYSQSKMNYNNNNVCNVHVVSDKVSPSHLTSGAPQHERSFKPVELIVSGRSALSPNAFSAHSRMGGVGPPHQHHIEQPQPVSHRVFTTHHGDSFGPGGGIGTGGGGESRDSRGNGRNHHHYRGFEQDLTPPFPHTTQFTGGGVRSVSPCSPPEQMSNHRSGGGGEGGGGFTSEKKHHMLSHSSISLPALKPIQDSINPHGGNDHQHLAPPDSISLASHRRSRAETDQSADMPLGGADNNYMNNPIMTYPMDSTQNPHQNRLSLSHENNEGGSVGKLKPGESFTEPQPIYTWGFQLWECFSDTKWCLITGFFPCVTEFLLSQTFGLQRLGVSFVVSSLSILSLLLLQFTLLTPNTDTLHIGVNDAFICNLLLYFLLMFRVFLAFKLRNRIRNEYRISGSRLGDCCVICVCPYCALCQMKQHHDYYDASDSEDNDDDDDQNSSTAGAPNVTLSPLNVASNHPKLHHNHNSRPSLHGIAVHNHQCSHGASVNSANHNSSLHYKSRMTREVRGFKQSPISQLGKFLDYSGNIGRNDYGNNSNDNNNSCCSSGRCTQTIQPTCRLHHVTEQPCCLGSDVVAMTHQCNNSFSTNHNQAHHSHICGQPSQSGRGNVWLVNPDSQSHQTILSDGTRVNTNMHRY